MEEYDSLFKVLLIGDSLTGKSSILTRFSDDTFSESYRSTIGVEFITKTLQIEDSRVKLQVWDTAGQERFRAITSAYYRGSNAILVVFDKTNRESFEHLDVWVEEMRRFAPPDVFFLIVGNKCDLVPQVTSEEAQEKAMRYQAPYIDVSSKTNYQIENLFGLVARKLLEMHKAKQNEKNDG